MVQVVVEHCGLTVRSLNYLFLEEIPFSQIELYHDRNKDSTLFFISRSPNRSVKNKQYENSQ